MTEDEAFEEISLLTQAETEPKLVIEELKLLVKRAKRVDDQRRVPTDNLWTPTWNIAASVALGWEMKAGKVATGYDFQSADQKFSRSQMYQQLMKVAAGWRKRAGESMRIKGDLAQGVTLPAVNENWYPYDWNNGWDPYWPWNWGTP